MKDRLVASFFYLGLVVIGLKFFGTIALAFHVMGRHFLSGLGLLIVALFTPLFLFVGLRLACELMVAVFHINDNLAPDGGKSDTADIDVFETAKDAATKAAQSASSATKSVVEKTKTKINERKDAHEDDNYPDYEDTTPAKPARKKPAAKKPVKKKTTPRKVLAKKSVTVKKATTRKKTSAKKTTAKKAPAKKRVVKKATKKK